MLSRFPILFCWDISICASAACSSQLEPRVTKILKALCSSEPGPGLSVLEYIAIPGLPLLGKAAFTGLLRTRHLKLMCALVPRENARCGVLN